MALKFFPNSTTLSPSCSLAVVVSDIPTLGYYSNDLPLVCTMHASSKCYFGVNLNPLCKPSEVSYTLIPNMCYFEFLPVNRSNGGGNLSDKEQQELVKLVDVKVGQEYELVVTTYADEVELQNAMKNAVTHLVPFDATVTEYTSYADTTTIPGHYMLYGELSLKGSTPIPQVVVGDKDHRTGDVRQADGLCSLGASINQYKTPMNLLFLFDVIVFFIVIILSFI